MRMRVFLVSISLMALASAASDSLDDLEFLAWKVKFDKIYKSIEEESQCKIMWLKNRKLVLVHNILADQGIKSYRLGMNHFSDMDNQDYRQSVLEGYLESFNRTKIHSTVTFPRQAEGTVLPDTVDWRKKGYVTEVKNGDCSWAFSATGSLEGQMFNKTHKLVSLSEQQLIDCIWPYGKLNCIGSVLVAFEYIKNNMGIDTEESYPYEGPDKVCRFSPANVGAACTGYEYYEIGGDEEALKKAVATIGPISVAIDANHRTFWQYNSGIFDEPNCSSIDLNLNALVVGYGTEDGKDYWLVKNSWGLKWGDKGYIKMSRNKNNQCGIATTAIYPLV